MVVPYGNMVGATVSAVATASEEARIQSQVDMYLGRIHAEANAGNVTAAAVMLSGFPQYVRTFGKSANMYTAAFQSAQTAVAVAEANAGDTGTTQRLPFKITPTRVLIALGILVALRSS